MVAHSDDVLKRIQATELEILTFFDSVCREHDIKYFCLFGTEIGAVRHKGFIPWDDDVDVGILREDYNKLLSLKDEFNKSEKYFFVDPADNVPYHEKVFSRVYKKNTVFSMEIGCGNYRMRDDQHKPLAINLFVFDFVDSPEESDKKRIITNHYKKLYLYSKFRVILTKGGNIKEILKNIIKLSVYIANRISFGRVNLRAYKKYVLNCISEPTEYIICYGSMEDKDIITSLCRYEDIFPLKRVPFEQAEVFLRNNYDSALRKCYGEYMTLPPVEKREIHPAIRLDFGDEK